MKPASFDYVRAASIRDVLSVLHAEGEQARILAGGQSLVPMLSMRLARPAVLVDITHVGELDRIVIEGGRITIGAAVTQAALLRDGRVSAACPLLAEALPWVGHAQTRSRGTVCGSIAHADPSAELPLCLAALGGEVHLASRRGRRTVAAGDFFIGMMTTDRADDEFIEAVSFPIAARGAGHGFREFGRRHGDFAIAAVAAVVSRDAIVVTVGGVDDVPARRTWPRTEGTDLDSALDGLAWELDARDDIHASARLRRDLVRSLGRDAIMEATRCSA